MILMSDVKTEENPMNRTSKPSDLQMYQAQLRKKLNDDIETPSLSRFLCAY